MDRLLSYFTTDTLVLVGSGVVVAIVLAVMVIVLLDVVPRK
jgi:hypothetical protein